MKPEGTILKPSQPGRCNPPLACSVKESREGPSPRRPEDALIPIQRCPTGECHTAHHASLSGHSAKTKTKTSASQPHASLGEHARGDGPRAGEKTQGAFAFQATDSRFVFPRFAVKAAFRMLLPKWVEAEEG